MIRLFEFQEPSWIPAFSLRSWLSRSFSRTKAFQSLQTKSEDRWEFTKESVCCLCFSSLSVYLCQSVDSLLFVYSDEKLREFIKELVFFLCIFVYLCQSVDFLFFCLFWRETMVVHERVSLLSLSFFSFCLFESVFWISIFCLVSQDTMGVHKRVSLLSL